MFVCLDAMAVAARKRGQLSEKSLALTVTLDTHNMADDVDGIPSN